jgi:copper homeostasis protein
MSRIKVEVCCGSLDDALEAQAGGADRVEFCSDLFHGGLTPSIGSVIEASKRLSIPFVAMVRPRGGGFCYTEPEFAAMLADAEQLLAHGACGIVFGILREDGTVDLERNRRLAALAGSKQSVFHRAIDVTPDPFEALEQIIDMGITRVLTSGQEDTVPDGVGMIKALREKAAGRIEVMPGGGIKPSNLSWVVEQTGCEWIHIAAFRNAYDPSCHARPHVTFGGALYPPEDMYPITDRDAIAGVMKTAGSL